MWLGAYLAMLLALVPIVARFERGSVDTQRIAAGRRIFGALICCVGLALLALGGVGGEGWLGLRVSVLPLPFIGAFVAGLWPVRFFAPQQV